MRNANSQNIKPTMKALTLSAMSSIPFAVKTTFAPAFKSFSMRSFVISASLKKDSNLCFIMVQSIIQLNNEYHCSNWKSSEP